MKLLRQRTITTLAFTIVLFAFNHISQAADEYPLYFGWARADITPQRPVNLVGQGSKRISTHVEDRLTATVLALETRGKDGPKEQAIMVSCDLCYIKEAIQKRLQSIISEKLDDFDSSKLFLNATHTHTGPGVLDGIFYGLYDVSKDEGVMKASEYGDFFVERMTEAVVRAWKNRKPGGMSWALGHAVVGYNRRTVYLDGSAKMYGNTNDPNFSNIEGYEDHGVEMIFFWDPSGILKGMIINIACPAQETEGGRYISADFWYDAREEIWNTFPKSVYIFPQCGAAGDKSPHLLYRKRAEQEMLKRKEFKAREVTRRKEIALRIADAVNKVFPYADKDIKDKVVFKHTVAKINLPTKEPPAQPFYKTDTVRPIESHIIRLGDIAMATNPFELYLDYGIRIKARSKAILTFVVQLSCQHCGYLPTRKAVRGGSYSAVKYIVGPKGGQMLVNETVKEINSMWQ